MKLVEVSPKGRFTSILAVAFGICLFAAPSIAQKRANYWYFGFNAGLEFNSGAPIVVKDGALNTAEGCAVLSDDQGNLLFYTDGVTVYDQTHTIMGNGTALSGNNSSAQSAVIIPMPGNADKYYIFNPDRPGGGNGIHYSIVDMTLNGGLGDIEAATKNTLVAAGTYFEAIGVANNAANDGYWVIVHELSNNRYKTFEITAGGVGSAVNSDVGATWTGSNIGLIKVSACFDKVAMSQYTFADDVDVLDFNNTTGVLSNAYLIDNLTKAYGVEFSPNGDYLYVTGLEGNQVIQYDLTVANIKGSQVSLGSGRHSETGALQTGPDGKIYVAQSNGNQGFVGDGKMTYLGVIENPNVGGAGANFNNEGPLFDEGAFMPYRGLPTFINDFTSNIIQLSYSDPCVNTSIDFTYTYTGTVQGSVTWDFDYVGNPGANTSSSDTPSHTYSTAGTYTVRLTITDAACGVTKSITEEVEVGPTPITDPNLEYCSGDPVDLTLGDANSYCYYEDVAENNLIGCGDTVAHTFSGTGTETVYVNLDGFTGGTYGPTDLPQNDGAWKSTTTMEFTALKALTIVSFDVESGHSHYTNEPWDISPTGGGASLGSGTFTATAGIRTTVAINVTLPPGDYTLSFNDDSHKFSNAVGPEDPSIIDFHAVNWTNGLAQNRSGYIAANWVIEPASSPWCIALPITIDEATSGCCFNPKPQAGLTAGIDTVFVCEGQSLDLTVTSGATSPTFIWSGPNSYSNSSATSSPQSENITSSASVTEEGWYYVAITSASCGAQSEMDSVYVQVNGLPSAGSGLNNASICAGASDSYAVISTDYTVFNWSLPSGASITTSNSDSSSVTIDWGTASTGTLSATPSNSCGAGSATSATITINQAPQGTGSISGATTACVGEQITYTVSGITGADFYTWTVPANTTGDGTTDTDNAVTFNSGTSAQIEVEPVNTCGTGSAIQTTVTLSPSVSPAITISSTATTICSGDPVTFDSVSTTGLGIGATWQWKSSVSGDVGTGSNDYTSSALVNGEEIYVEISGITGCVSASSVESNRITMTVTGAATPSINITTDDSTLCAGETSSFSITGSVGLGATPTYRWIDSAGDTVSTSDSYGPVSSTDGETIQLYARDLSSCASSPTVLSNVISMEIDDVPTTPAIAESNFNTCIADTALTNSSVASGTLSWRDDNASVIVSTTSGTTADVTGIPANTTVRVYLANNSANNFCPEELDSIDITRLAALTVPDAGAALSICESSSDPILAANSSPVGGESQTWSAVGPASINTSSGATSNLAIGTNKFYLTMTNGSCTLLDSVNVTVDSLPSIGSSVSAGIDSSICTSDLTLYANPLPSGMTGAWTGTGGVSFSSPDATSATALVSGLSVTHTLTWTVTNGACQSSDDVDITKIGDLTTPVVGSDEDICVTQTSFNLSANTPGSGETGLWTVFTGSGTIANDASPSTSVSALGMGANTLRWTISNGSCPSASADIVITVQAAPSSATLGNDTTVCGTDITLVAPTVTQGTGQWTTTSGASIAAASSNSTSVSGLSSGTNSFTWTVSTGGACADESDQIVVSSVTNATPSVALGVNKSPACLEEDMGGITYTATPSNAGIPTYAWTLDGTAQTETSSSFTPSSIANGQIVKVEITAGITCVTTPTADDQITALVVGRPNPTMDASDKSACDQLTLSAIAENNSNSLNWMEVGVGSLAETNESFTTFSSGSFVFAESIAACATPGYTDTVLVTINQTPDVIIADDVISIELGETATFVAAATPSSSALTWTTTSGQLVDSPNSATTDITPTAGGILYYSLEADNGGCTDIANLELRVRIPVIIPNVFSPNADGINDLFGLTGIETYPEASVIIFNRWGNEIYSTYGDYASSPWDGNGMPVGTYYYVIQFNDGSDALPESGYVELIR